MKRSIVLIDGFNIYHSLEEKPSFHKYKWLNLRRLAELFIEKNEQLIKVFYFSAYAYWKPNGHNPCAQIVPIQLSNTRIQM